MSTDPAGDDFVELIASEVAADPDNLALREDFVTLLLGQDLTRAASELAQFEQRGGSPSRVAVLKARLMAARLRTPDPVPPAEPAAHPVASDAPRPVDAPDPVPTPATSDTAPGEPAHRADSLWDTQRPTVTLSDVAGLADVKHHLNTTFLAPLRSPELAAAFGQKPGGSLLMYGPPGCGKTYIAKAIAGDLGASFIHVTLADLLSKWLGDSEKAIQSVFRDARAAAPCVIFFDEFDALGGKRSSAGADPAGEGVATRPSQRCAGPRHLAAAGRGSRAGQAR